MLVSSASGRAGVQVEPCAHPPLPCQADSKRPEGTRRSQGEHHRPMEAPALGKSLLVSSSLGTFTRSLTSDFAGVNWKGKISGCYLSKCDRKQLLGSIRFYKKHLLRLLLLVFRSKR